MRVWNPRVFKNIQGVLEAVLILVQGGGRPSPQPSTKAERAMNLAPLVVRC